MPRKRDLEIRSMQGKSIQFQYPLPLYSILSSKNHSNLSLLSCFERKILHWAFLPTARVGERSAFSFRWKRLEPFVPFRSRSSVVLGGWFHFRSRSGTNDRRTRSQRYFYRLGVKNLKKDDSASSGILIAYLTHCISF